ncbi:MAG TPA: DUF2330 domain-containing protein [Polyangiaceae bacterium]|nr:DUF2330 domain-containing protein [Polyangiaceae bacterium]
MKLSALLAITALLSWPFMSRSAEAFGGVWSSRTARVRQAGEEILFVDNPDATMTAIVRMSYVGSSERFAWVIPVRGKPKIGVSSSTVFRRLEAATAPEYLVEVTTKGACKGRRATKSPDGGVDTAPSDVAGVGDAAAPVREVERGFVDPYDYVVIKVDANNADPTRAATDWLSKNGYDLTNLERDVLAPYLKDDFALLAIRLTSHTDAGDVRPVVLTYDGKLPVIPLRPASVSAAGEVGIRVWVVGASQAVPQNYESLVLDEARIDWLSCRTHRVGTLPAGGSGPFGPDVRLPRNYDAVVSAAVREAGGRGFVTELAGPASQYRERVWSALDEQQAATLLKRGYADGVDAVIAAKERFGGWDGFEDAVFGATTPSAGVAIDEFVRAPADHREDVTVDTKKFLRLLREKVTDPVAAAGALLHGGPYLTRLYTRMSPDAMTVDPVFDYNEDLAQVGATHIAKQLVRCRSTLSQREAPWRLRLPHGGTVAGKGSAWPIADGMLPANLKRVSLSSSGSGTVVQDNGDAIGGILFELAGPTTDGEPEMPRLSHDGVLIGGTEEVVPHGSTSTSNGAKPSGGHCSISSIADDTDAGVVCWPLAALVLFDGRRRRTRGGRCRS